MTSISDPDSAPRAKAVLPQTAVVVEGIKQMIMSGELTPGSRLPIEKDLAARLGVSRGSLREGVRALAVTGVLETRQGAGTYVTALDPKVLLSPVTFLSDLHRVDDLLELQSVRRVLETEAAGRAARHITAAELAEAEAALAAMDELLRGSGGIDHDAVMDADVTFHRVIARASRNTMLEALIEALTGRTVRARLWRAINEEGAEHTTHAEHRAILEALRSGDPDAARLRMGVHLLAVEQFLTENADAIADAHGG